MNLNLNETLLFLNPALPNHVKDIVTKLSEAHFDSGPKVWIMSSGTSATTQNSYKLMCLSQKAMVISAQAVNEHLQVQQQDRWLNVLPLFHVGGLGILYRAHLANCEYINQWNHAYKWDPKDFTQLVKLNNITLSSLVPTQVFDLVKNNLSAPSCLKAIVIGGAKINEDLYRQARSLGWPLLPSFGMTECCSQIATADLESLSDRDQFPPLRILSHVEIQTTDAHQIKLKSQSLFDGYYPISDGLALPWTEPFDSEEWYLTQDCGKIENRILSIFSRIDDVIKVSGENVNLSSLRNRLSSILSRTTDSQNWTIIAIPEPRKGHSLAMVSQEALPELQLIKDQFNKLVLPYERIEFLFPLTEVPRNSLGKINHALLVQKILSKIPTTH